MKMPTGLLKTTFRLIVGKKHSHICEDQKNIKKIKTKNGKYMKTKIYAACLMIFCSASYAKITVCFTPKEQCEHLFVATIDKAKQSLDVQEYRLSSPPIIDAILRASHRGVKVVVVLDKTAEKEAAILAKAGIPTYIDYRVAIAHNKVMIIDRKLLILGSYNPTESAQLRNAENLIIWGNKRIVKLFENNFNSRRFLSRIQTNEIKNN